MIRSGAVLDLGLIFVGQGQHLDRDGQCSALLKGLGSLFVVSQSVISVSKGSGSRGVVTAYLNSRSIIGQLRSLIYLWCSIVLEISVIVVEVRLRAYNVWQISKFLSCKHHPDILLFGFGEWWFKTRRFKKGLMIDHRRTRTCWGILVFEDYLSTQCNLNLCILAVNILLHTSYY
jgi:hypothetical protein